MEDEMPKGYIVVSYLELPTEENLSNYAPKAMEAIKNAGGKFIARGMPVATYENGMNQRAVVVEFESTDAALKGQTVSSSYKPATLDNGLNIQVPPFIEAGDEIVVDTRNLEYIKKI